ncbi:unnamed protein product [Dovyalis caffra]|uniref:Uncharacterized protein n=1 Tax=Dovyalis caffra TaxID=77055 RepID=A0AAV1QQ69_9ROSI|nr:unnamed protein product [Dovyalis caffra]
MGPGPTLPESDDSKQKAGTVRHLVSDTKNDSKIRNRSIRAFVFFKVQKIE